VPPLVLPARTPPAPAGGGSLPAVLWRSRWLVLLCLLAAAAGGVGYIGLVTPRYTSTAKLCLDYAGIRIRSPYESGGRPQTDKYLSTEAEFIKSRPILAAALELLAPQRLRTFEGTAIPGLWLQENLTVEIGKKDEVISIRAGAPDPNEAAQIVNAVLDAYLASRSARGQRSSAQALKVLQDALSHAGQELAEKRNELADFQQNKMPLALGSDQGGGIMQEYQDLKDAYTQARIKRMGAETFYAAVQALADDPDGLRQYVQLRGGSGLFASADQERTTLAAKLVASRAQKETLLQTFTDDAPNVIAVSAEIGRTEARLRDVEDRLVRSVMAAAERQYLEAQQYEEQVARSCQQQQERVVQSNAEVAQYQRLRSEVDHLTTYSQTLEQQVREVRQIVGEDVDQLRLAVLERGLPAAAPSEPQKGRIMAMALILGLLCGGGIAVTRDWLDQTLRSADEIAALLGVPVLGAAPAMSRRRSLSDRGRCLLLDPDSREAEAFRTIRTAVLFGTARQGAKTLLVTSPAAGDGKSTIVSNLAIAMARAGHKTLVLDADLRRPGQHAIFGLDPRERCLQDVFAGTLPLSAAVQATDVPRLAVLTCGHAVSNPAEILHSRKFARLLACLAEVYDRIVVDAPPVTPVTDAQILGGLCDATILVLKADKCLRHVAQHTLDALQSVGACLLGVIVNEVHGKGDRYGYYPDRYARYYRAGQRKNDIVISRGSGVVSVPTVSGRRDSQ
jgi:succinoglycan biosynthesis transport protein ExoP